MAGEVEAVMDAGWDQRDGDIQGPGQDPRAQQRRGDAGLQALAREWQRGRLAAPVAAELIMVIACSRW